MGKEKGRMKRIVSGISLTLLLASMFVLALNIQLIKATGTIYIRADGSIDPSAAPISTVDNDTYILTGNIASDVDGIVIERDNIVLDGAGFTIQGSGSGNGTSLTDRSNVTIKNTNITAFHLGIYLFSSSKNVFLGNNIAGDSFGIYLDSSSENIVVGNSITSNWYGIVLYYSSNYNSISGNNITDNSSVGIGLGSDSGPSSNNSIIGNNITNSLFGIGLNDASDTNMSENTITNNWYGISLYSSSNNRMSGNTLTSNNYDGIRLTYSSDNTISENTIINNSDHGIVLDSSFNNLICHNNFIDNTQQVSATVGYVNIWDEDYPSGGNFWSDYNDTDVYSGPNQNETGSDGIWDHPYVIEEDNRDNYPLVSPFWYWSNSMSGDINKDMIVDLRDIFSAANAFGSYSGHARWNPASDINHDDLVDMMDMLLIAVNFGKQHT